MYKNVLDDGSMSFVLALLLTEAGVCCVQYNTNQGHIEHRMRYFVTISLQAYLLEHARLSHLTSWLTGWIFFQRKLLSNKWEGVYGSWYHSFLSQPALHVKPQSVCPNLINSLFNNRSCIAHNKLLRVYGAMVSVKVS